ncbi:MAG: hypothetical protein RLZZ511_3125 [Cyanobacteriota bacterium]|jgi:hypothetical protein
MTQQPQITITIAPDGTLKTEVNDVQGQSCTALTKPLEQLGTTATQTKPEFYETAAVDLTVSLGG